MIPAKFCRILEFDVGCKIDTLPLSMNIYNTCMPHKYFNYIDIYGILPILKSISVGINRQFHTKKL